MESTDHPDIIVFDGVCNLCNGLVQFVIKRDRTRRFTFASQQSDAGKALLCHHGLDAAGSNTVLVIVDGKPYIRSTAALKLTQALGGPWKMMGVFWLVPRPIRDWVYGIIARNRYRWFGKRESCMIPQDDLTDRFL